MIAVIDNYDSFTYNLVQYLGELGAEIRVWRNDAITPDELRTLAPSHIVISPGPGTPEDAGVSNDVISAFHGQTPILGVCLGHQCMGHVFGGKVGPAPRLMHGKVSPVYHTGDDLFADIPTPFQATSGCYLANRQLNSIHILGLLPVGRDLTGQRPRP